MNRIDSGYQLFLKGKVRLLPQTHEDFIEFEVDGSNHMKYKVEFDLKEGTARCFAEGCPDYENRAKYADGSFTCKHINAAFFKLAEIKGLHEQTTLDGVKV